MESLIESTARKFGVPTEVLDLIGRDYVFQLTKELPGLMLPPLMSDLKQVCDRKGMNWIEENVDYLRKQLRVLRQMYGPADDEDFSKPEYHHIVLP
jgi:hypothetical protein